MPQFITANELKTKGVAILDSKSSDEEIIVTVRGKSRFVVLPMETYNRLRECELEAALIETRNDIKNGKFKKESVDAHLKRLSRG
jgi:prevent-host-death family protein